MIRHLPRLTRGMGFALLAGILLAHSAQGAPITGIVSFGDSLSDVGNYYELTGGASPSPLQGYAAGEFTNGLNWVQYLAQDLGVAMPTASLHGGTDYAYGGAMSGSGTTQGPFWDASFNPVTATVPNLGDQIAGYLASSTPTAGQLYTIWAGANDLLHTPDVGAATAIEAADNVAGGVLALAKAGAKQIIVGNLPLLGELPYIKMFLPSTGAGLDALTGLFNARLQGDLAALQGQVSASIHLLDVASLYGDAVANPSKYGFTDVSDAALFLGSDGQGFLSWDGIHPTTQAQAIIGSLAAQSVPEPSSMILFGLASAALAAMSFRRRAISSTSR